MATTNLNLTEIASTDTVSDFPTVYNANLQKIDAAAIKTTILTLAAADWSSEAQTVTATGITADSTVIVTPSPASLAAYQASGVYCSAQAADSLTFACTTTPSADLTVNVLYW